MTAAGKVSSLTHATQVSASNFNSPTTVNRLFFRSQIPRERKSGLVCKQYTGCSRGPRADSGNFTTSHSLRGDIIQYCAPETPLFCRQQN